MAIIRSSSAELIAFFETGDIPTSDNFNDLIRSTAVYDGSLPIISGSSVSTGSFGHLVVTSDSVGSHLIPDTTLTYDLGSGSKLWNVAYINQLSGSGTTGESNITASLSIIPGVHNTYNLGTSSAEWKDLFVNGVAYIATASNNPYVTIPTASIDYFSSSLIPGNDDKMDLGSSTKEWKDLYIDGIAYIDSASITNTDIATVSSDLLPTVDNTKDLGSVAKSWKDLHVQGTATIGTLSLSNVSSDHITASGVISGSSTSSLIIGGTATIGSLSADSASIDHHITASCNISSSGTITGDKLVINSPSGIAATITTASFNYISSSLIPGNNNIQDLGNTNKRWNNLHISGTANIYYSASIGSASIGYVSSDLIPVTTVKKDLGSATLKWKDLFVSGTAYIPRLSGSGATGDSAITASVNIVPGVDDTYSLGSTGLEWKDLFVDGTANIDDAVIGTLTLTTISSDFDPTATNTYALGATSKRFTELYTTSQSLSVSASISAIKFENLPTSVLEASLIGSGSLFLSGSRIANEGGSGSKALHVYVG